MSHAATNWAIKQRGLKPAAKIVLWHLADCHNGHSGQCNPRQALLAHLCEMSKSTLNVHLAGLEKHGLIRRHRDVDPATKKQRPTHYSLAMDEGFGRKKPESGSGTRTQDVGGSPQDIVEPSPETGPGAESGKQQKPSPDSGQTRVRNPDSIENPGIEPGKVEPCAPVRADDDFDFEEFVDRFLAAHPRPGAHGKTLAWLRTIIGAGADPDQLLAAARAYAVEQKGNEARYIAYSENWLAGERWQALVPAGKTDPRAALEGRAKTLRSGKPYLCTRISSVAARECIAAGMVTPAQCAASGVEV